MFPTSDPGSTMPRSTSSASGSAILVATLAVAGLAPAAGAQEWQPIVPIVIETDVGTIEAEIFLAQAPRTAENFLRYVDAGLYDGGTFHRTVRGDNQPDDPIRIAVVQAAMDPERRDQAFPPIELERTSESGLNHLDGTLSMARAGPDTARDQFFICVGPQPELDFEGRRNPDGQGFAPFGKVVSGMDVVHRIHQAPAAGQTLQPPIRILSIRRKEQ